MPQPFFDPGRPYDVNFDKGPYGAFKKPKKYKESIEPQYTLLGYKVNSPFGIPAGPLLNSKYISAAFKLGFDVCIYKTQRNTVFQVNDFPNVLFVDVKGNLTLKKASKPLIGKSKTSNPPEKFTITNSFGNPSRGPKFWVSDLKKALQAEGKGQLLIFSVVGTIKKGAPEENYYDDFAETAKKAAKVGVKAIEINLSCPNVANEGVLCYTPRAVGEICRKVKRAVGKIPVIAKIGYYSRSQQKLLETVVRRMNPYVAAIAAINTIPAPIVNKKGGQALPGPNRLKSGMCGAGIRWAGLDMAKRLKTLRKKLKASYEIIGVGGVMTPRDYLAYRKAGVDCVMSATGAMWNPYLAQEIKKQLE